MRTLAIIGAGGVGGALGRRWAGAGRRVLFASRAPTSPKIAALVAAAGPNAAAAGLAEAAAQADAAALTLPWEAVAETLPPLADALAGKVLIDATNPLGPVEGGLGLLVGHRDSGGEIVQRLAPRARVVKAFNTVGVEVMANPSFPGGAPALFLAGDDAAAKAEVAALAEATGFAPIDAGPLRNARLTEAHAMLWIDLALFRGLGRDWALAKLDRAGPAAAAPPTQ
jgi:hypothetical protein